MKTIVLIFCCMQFVLCGYSQNAPTKSDSSITESGRRTGDYIKFNVLLGMSVNGSYSNKMYRIDKSHSPNGSSEDYLPAGKESYNSSINLGFTVLLGKNPYIKHLVGVNYLRSKGEFNYSYSSIQGNSSTGWENFSQELNYKSKVDFINIVTGIRFTIAKKFHIEPCVALNQLIHSDVRITGTAETVSISGSSGQPTDVKTEYYNVLKVSDPKIGSTFSFCPKVSYEFNIRQQKAGVYISYNMALNYRLPWWMFGATWYPFKKLR